MKNNNTPPTHVVQVPLVIQQTTIESSLLPLSMVLSIHASRFAAKRPKHIENFRQH